MIIIEQKPLIIISKNPLFASKSLLAERDIDLIDNNIVDLFQKEFATTSDTNILTEKRDFFKRIFNLI